MLPSAPAGSPFARLDPDSAAAAAALLAASRSVNTERSYKAAEAYWQHWHEQRYGEPLPIPLERALPPERVIQFIVDHVPVPGADRGGPLLPPEIERALIRSRRKAAQGTLSVATVRHRLSVMSRLHAPFPDNHCRSYLVVQMLKAARKAGKRPRRAPALTRELLDRLLATCDASLIGVRDRALLLFAWSSGGRRRSEVVYATLDNTIRQEDGSYLFELAHSKTNQNGEDEADNFKPVRGTAAAALDLWLQRSGIRSGALFCQLRRGGHVIWADQSAGRAAALTDAGVNAIVKARCKASGLNPKAYSAHSLRSGYVTQAQLDEVPMDQAMRMSGHKSLKMFMHYGRISGVAADLYDRAHHAGPKKSDVQHSERGQD